MGPLLCPLAGVQSLSGPEFPTLQSPELQAWEAQKWVLGVTVNGPFLSSLWFQVPGCLTGLLQTTFFSGLVDLFSLGNLYPAHFAALLPCLL